MTVRLETIGAVARVTIDNPPVNALTDELYAELRDVAVELELRDDVRAVVFDSAHESIFVAGADVRRMAEYDFRRGAVLRKVDLVQGTFMRLQRLAKPTIAVIAGHALGGGCELAMALDFRVMSRGEARIGLPEVGLGIVPGGGGTQRLPRLVGRAKALEMVLLASRLDADEAVRVGLVGSAHDGSEAARDHALELAEKLAQMPPSSVRLVKTAIDQGFENDLPAGLAAERSAVAEALLSPEAKEGIAAFLEHRAPRFE